MCGIFGFVTSGRQVFDTSAALRALAHRGPDGEGTYVGDAGQTHCELAHTRLSVIDLSDAGSQPMPGRNGRYQIVYNGELYNHAAVRRDLEREGVAFRSTSDTEVIVESFAQWGPACVERFRGMFAFAIWDSVTGALFLARDRLGIKPLYVVKSTTFVAFASEVRALLAAGVAPRRLCLTGLRSYLTWGAVSEPHTIIAGVECLPPGSVLLRQPSSISQSTYWELRPRPTIDCSQDEAVAHIRPVLEEATALHLVADVPVGVFLSGGIDSSVITGLAARACPERLHTFAVAFREESHSEAGHAAEVARAFGCSHHAILLDPERVRNEMHSAVAALDQPSSDGMNTFFVAQAVRATRIKVALSGLGGDEIFAGYDSFRWFGSAETLAGSLPTQLAGPLHAMASSRPLQNLPSRFPKLINLLTGDSGLLAAYAATRSMFTPIQAAAIMAPGLEGVPPPQSAWPGASSVGKTGGELDPIAALTTLELGNYLRNVLLRDADMMSMAHALEVRVPLLDHVLVEAVLPLAARLKLSPHTNKPLLVAAGPPLPRSVTHRAKMGFALPYETWFRGPLRASIEKLLVGDAAANVGALRQSTVKLAWENFLQGDARMTATRIWALAALVAWCQENEVAL